MFNHKPVPGSRVVFRIKHGGLIKKGIVRASPITDAQHPRTHSVRVWIPKERALRTVFIRHIESVEAPG